MSLSAGSIVMRARDILSDTFDYTSLVTGAIGTAAVATWQAVDDASLQVSYAGTLYSLTALDLTGLTFANIAAAIQAAIRTATSGSTETCTYSAVTGRFTISDSGGATVMDYLQPGLAGTDIAVAAWMNGLANGPGYLTGSDTNARWSREMLLRWLTDGKHLLWMRRPEVRIASDSTLDTFAEIDELSDPLGVSDYHAPALVDYICFRAFSMSRDDRNDVERAQEHLAQFERAMAA